MDLKSERIYLRHFQLKDADGLFELDSDPDVMKYMSREPAESIEESVEVIEKQISYYKDNQGLGVFPAFLTGTNDFMGWFALKDLDNTEKIEVGFKLKKKFWNKGYATEMTKVLIHYGFDIIRLNKIYAVTHPENVASQRVLEKCGLEFIGMDTYYKTKVRLYVVKI